ncbi:Pkinase-domain-containing protein [Parathielavia appendiculata]|uniref:Pkinase-domain-containing protein n=1 Tax=Parathielavia appendiculata TaxID=2587402 RepID=A0AAN6U0W1_9PEZI|nr:Pkinase-domain-containing protein [Parathielavia appendiculata]
MSAAQTAGQPQVQPCRYKVGKVLGAGSYSVVKECIHIDTGRYYAAKVINKRLMAGREHMVRNEIAVLKKVSMGHQNILTLVDYFETMNNLYLVTDLALGGELFDRICRKGSYYESDAADLIRAVLSAVAYLHDHGIVHRDLKPENLLFRTPEDNADLLIADFGLSRIMDEEQFHVLTTTCGTPGYMAPEIFKKTGHGKPVDLWALGVITYFLLCGYTPFDRDSDFEEMQAILNADYSFTPLEYWRGVSDSAKDFIRRCLTIDPAKRMTAHEALQHPFVAGWALRAAAAGGDGALADKGQNLLPTVKKNFNARRTLHAAIDTVRAINKLREGQAYGNNGLMNGVRSREPGRNGGGNGNHDKATDHQLHQHRQQQQTQNQKENVAPRKDDSGIAILAQNQSQDSGYGSTQTQNNTQGSSSSAERAQPGGGGDGDDVKMEDAPPSPPPHHGGGPGQMPLLPSGVPASLRPGSEANRVVETSKGLWSGVASRR